MKTMGLEVPSAGLIGDSVKILNGSAVVEDSGLGASVVVED